MIYNGRIYKVPWLRIVGQTVHLFRSNPSTDSDSNRPPVLKPIVHH